ncbi:MAG: hypothetical protein VX847_05775 [Pseudomonadota bacterium]|nr:hypothetical protein [Pseudomonadota bacterium]
MLNKDLINHRFPGGSFILSKEINDLIMSSTGLEDDKELIDKDLGHPIFSMIALNSIGYTLDELFKLLNYDVQKGPMLGECNFNLLENFKLDKSYKVNGFIESFESKVSKKVGNIDIMNFKLEITSENRVISEIDYKWILPN